LAVSIAVTEPFPWTVRNISTWDQTGTLDALFIDPVDLATIFIIITWRTNTLTVSTDVFSLALVVLLTNRRRCNRKAATVKADLIFACTIGVIFAVWDNFNALAQLACKFIFAVSVNEALGWRR
tara:strand:- start:391 stop:762 length:372 start_codon:yes stop_codon:yes gene_type:complete